MAFYCKVADTRCLQTLCKEGQVIEACQALECMVREGKPLAIDILAGLLQYCISKSDLVVGRQVYSIVISSNSLWNTKLGCQLIRMFASCGSVMESLHVFSSLQEHNVYSWTAIILAHAQHGQCDQALMLYNQMQISAVKPNSYTFVAALKACVTIAALDKGKLIHADILRQESELDIFVGSTLVDMYSKCGNLEDACKVFDKLPEQDVVSWSAMIAGYTQHGHGWEALHLYKKMLGVGMVPNKVIFVCILKAIASIGSLDKGSLIHTDIIKRGHELDIFVRSSLVDMYTKCGSLEDARNIFDELSLRDVALWNSMMGGYAQHGNGQEALWLFEEMSQKGIEPNELTFVHVLKSCSITAAQDQGKLIHAAIRQRSLESDPFVGNTLVDMYAKCGSLGHAREVFDKLSIRDVVSWNTMIAGYADHGKGQEALQLLKKMQQEGTEPDKVTFVCSVKACTSTLALNQGKLLHSEIVERGLESDKFVGSTLVDMYVKCSSMKDALEVFHKLPERDAAPWSSIITGYLENGHGPEALQLFEKMKQEGAVPDKLTFACLLKFCANTEALDQGRLIHADMLKRGLQSEPSLGDDLVRMYAKCGSLEDSRKVFDMLAIQGFVSYYAIIAGYAQHGQGGEALLLFEKMVLEGIEPDKVAFVCILNVCSSLVALDEGKFIHAGIVKQGLESELFVGSALADMYANCGCLDDASNVFDNLPVRNVVSWNAILGGYTKHGYGQEALLLFEEMLQEGLVRDEVTYICILKACSSMLAINHGKLIHNDIMKDGREPNLTLSNTLIYMYAKCGSLGDACNVLERLPVQDVVSWSAMMAGYVEHDHSEEALKLFGKMQDYVKPDKVTFACTLKACSNLLALVHGKLIHAAIVNRGFDTDPFIGSTLVDMYAKCGSLEDACKVFGKLLVQNVVSWSVIIAAYAEQGHGEEALQLFERMQQEGNEPDKVTYVCTMKACSSVGALDGGKLIHADLLKQGLESDPFVVSTLIDMYAKCGTLEDAFQSFVKLPERDLVSWNAIIGGYADHGYCKKAQQCFESMQQEGIKPDDVTFVCLLSGCSHAGSVLQGYYYFECIRKEFGHIPTIEHHICMLDILGRAGYLVEAVDLAVNMPFRANSVVWMTVLGSCAKFNNLDLGRYAFECLVKSDCRNGSGYALMSNIYSANRMWEEAQKIKELAAYKKAWKTKGKSWIEVNKKTHVFSADDKSHPQIDYIYAEMKKLKGAMEEEGYVSHLNSVLRPLAEVDKEDALCGHSEKLALVFGLMNTAPGTPLRIFKNLRTCIDCHNAFLIISKIEGREIVARDASRFHHFKDGVCSCRDFW